MMKATEVELIGGPRDGETLDIGPPTLSIKWPKWDDDHGIVSARYAINRRIGVGIFDGYWRNGQRVDGDSDD